MLERQLVIYLFYERPPLKKCLFTFLLILVMPSIYGYASFTPAVKDWDINLLMNNQYGQQGKSQVFSKWKVKVQLKKNN